MRAHPETRAVEFGDLRRACTLCALNDLCWPMGLDLSDLAQLRSIVRRSGPLAAGSYLFRVDDPFTALFAVRSGCIKSFNIDAGGRERVHGFHLRGELFGFDAIYPDRHQCNSMVLESGSVCAIPYRDIAKLSAKFRSLQTQVLRLMSQEFSKQLCFAEGHSANQRIAMFLQNIHARLQRTGLRGLEFRLPMSREDISNYLGIAPETLSRLMTRLHRKGVVWVDRRKIRLVDPIRLDLIARGVLKSAGSFT